MYFNRFALFIRAKRFIVVTALTAVSAFFASMASAAPLLYAYLNGNYISFRANAPGTVLSTLNDIGTSSLPNAFDFRLTNGDLYALYSETSGTSGDTYSVRRINMANGYVQQVGIVGPALVPNGSRFGMAFDPYLDTIRVTTSSGNHLSLNPGTGGASTYYSNLEYASGDAGFGILPVIEHIAFTNAVSNPTDTTLYGIDTARNVLVRIGPANVTGSSSSSIASTISSAGSPSLGFNAESLGGFVIDPATDVGYLAANVSVSGVNTARLYSVNLTTGGASLIGNISDGTGLGFVRGLALAPEVNPCLDIDGDGVLNATRDGLMYTRILLGLTGSAVTANAISTVNPPPRRTWSAIRTHLVNDCRMTLAP